MNNTHGFPYTQTVLIFLKKSVPYMHFLSYGNMLLTSKRFLGGECSHYVGVAVTQASRAQLLPDPPREKDQHLLI